MSRPSFAPSLTDLLDQRAWLAGLANALVRDPHDAADAAQETWLQALTRRAALREPRAWLATVLANVVRQRHRGDSRRRRREQHVGEAAPAEDTVAEANERFEVQRTVAAAVQELDEPFRTTVLLHHFEGMALVDIARTQQVPAGTVRWRLHRAHERLRQRLATTYGQDRWRACALLLCLPKRSAVGLPMLAVAALLLVGTLLAWAPWAVTEPMTPQHPIPTVAAAPTSRDESGASTVASRTVAALPVADAAGTVVDAAGGELRATVQATVVDGDGVPLPGATLSLTELKPAATRSGIGMSSSVPKPFLDRLAPPTRSDADGKVRLVLHAGSDVLELLPENALRDLVGEAEFTIAADGHAAKQVTAHLAPADAASLGTIVLQALATVSGRVQFADGSPAAGAAVRVLTPPLPQFPDSLARQGFAGGREPATTTGYDGTFTLPDTNTGIGLLWASLPGYTSAYAPLDVTGPLTRGPTLVLRATAEVARQTWQKEVRLLVVDPAGAPVPEARVDNVWYVAGGPRMTSMTRTNPDGRTSLEPWQPCYEEPSRLALAVMHEERRLGPVLFDVPLHGDEEVRLQLPAATTFAVRVETADGSLLPSFTASWQAVAPAVGKLEQTAVQGVATMLTPASPATLTVQATGFAQRQLPIGPGQADVRITLAPQRGIAGVVTRAGKPVAAARVSLLHCNEPVLQNGFRSEGERRGFFDARTNAQGRFHIDQSEPENVRLLVRAEGCANHVTELHAFDPARGWNDLTLELAAGGNLEGVVRDADGAPRPRVFVAINDFFGDAHTVLSDAEGRYRCGPLRAGAYEVRVTDRGITDDHQSTMSGGMRATVAAVADCEVRNGETTVYDVKASRCRIVGHVIATGFAARGWRASLQRSHDRWSGGAPVPVAIDGAFTLMSSSGGPHVVSLDAPGGPFGNVHVEVPIELHDGDNPVLVPLALAPFRSVATTADPAAWHALLQERGERRITVSIDIDPVTLGFATALAPVGEVVLQQGTSTGSVEVARFVVTRR